MSAITVAKSETETGLRKETTIKRQDIERIVVSFPQRQEKAYTKPQRQALSDPSLPCPVEASGIPSERALPPHNLHRGESLLNEGFLPVKVLLQPLCLPNCLQINNFPYKICHFFEPSNAN